MVSSKKSALCVHRQLVSMRWVALCSPSEFSSVYRCWYTSHFGRMVEEDQLNLVSNRTCVSIAVQLKRLSTFSFNLSIPNAAFYIINRRTASTSQCAPTISTEAKERPNITRDGNPQVLARLNTSTFPMLYSISLGCIMRQPVCFKWTVPTTWGLNPPPQPYSQNNPCISSLCL